MQNLVLDLYTKFHCNCGQTVSEKYKLDNSAHPQNKANTKSHY